MVVDYSNAKIYKIYNTIDDEIYVGSTCTSLSMRMVKHRCSAKQQRTQHYKLYQKMNEIGIENFFIILLKEFKDCQNKEQLRKMEGEYITELRPSLNHRLTGRESKEWFNNAENQERKKEMDKRYYWNNKEQRQEEHKVYYQERKEDRLIYQKEYAKNNIEKVKEYQKNWRSKKVNCHHCGQGITRGSLTRHMKSQHS